MNKENRTVKSERIRRNRKKLHLKKTKKNNYKKNKVKKEEQTIEVMIPPYLVTRS